MSSRLSVTGIVFAVAAAAFGQGQVAYSQPWDGLTGGRLATAWPDQPNLSTYQFDGFHLSQAANITQVRIFGQEAGDPSSDTGYGLRISRMASFTDPETLYYSRTFGTSSYQAGNLIMETGGEPITLSAGDYYITAWAIRPSEHGSWRWRGTTPVIGGEAIFHNPGGGQGHGTNPLPGSGVYGEVRDMAFTLYTGDAPEPTSIAALMLGVPLIWRKLRR